MWWGLRLGNLELLPYLCYGPFVLAITVVLTLIGIRRLNQTWLDPDWRSARRLQRLKYDLITKHDSLNLLWNVQQDGDATNEAIRSAEQPNAQEQQRGPS